MKTWIDMTDADRQTVEAAALMTARVEKAKGASPAQVLRMVTRVVCGMTGLSWEHPGLATIVERAAKV